MTFDDDTLILMFDGGRKIAYVKKCGLQWPPPELIEIQGFKMRQTRRSEITDEQRAGMTHVCRCAEYYPVREKDVGGSDG